MAVVWRAFSLSCWSFLVWVILTWTLTVEQLAFGAAVAVAVGWSLAGLGKVSGPWVLLSPRRLGPTLVLTARAAVSIVKANISLTRRIWSPSRPLRPGMVIVPTDMRTEAGVAAVGIVTSLIVDNQIVDVDRNRNELQYHAIWIESDDPAQNAEVVNAPVERQLQKVLRAR